MHKIEAMLKEYETLRQESLDSMGNRTQIVSFGLATVGVLAAAVLSLDSPAEAANLVVLVFSIGIPTISVLVLYVWLGEVERMMRAGNYLRILEGKINAEFGGGEPALEWEQWLRSGAQMKYPYVVVIALFLGLAFAAPIVGVVATELSWRTATWALLLPWAGSVVVGMHIWRRTRQFK